MFAFNRFARSCFLLPLVLGLAAACEDDSGELGVNGNPRLLDAGADSSLPDFSQCMATTVSLGVELATDPTLLGLRACQVDSDCTVVPVQFQCPAQDISTGLCGLFSNRSNVDAARARVVSLQDSLCGQLTPHCRSAAKCNSQTACVDHVCARPVPDAGTP